MQLSSTVGNVLKPFHAGESHLAWNAPAVLAAPATIRLTSPAFVCGGPMARKHAGVGVGDNVSPALRWSGLPRDAVELVLLIEDTGAPTPRPLVHSVTYYLPPTLEGLPEGRLSDQIPEGVTSDGVRLGQNSFGHTRYDGPRPIPGHGPYTYVFQLIALSKRLTFARPPTKAEVLEALEGAVLAKGRLNGTYERL